MKPKSIRLFIKPYCGWCDEVMEWFAERGIPYETLDVTRNAAARAEMWELTGQTRAPSLDVDGEILADFGADELETWWQERGFEPQG
ncbi:MAG: glutaredoxin family protein [Verrucomicrobiota bacterium]